MPPIIPIPHEVPTENGEGGSSNEPAENLVSDSDTLSEDEEHDGYEPLSQDPDNCNDNHSDLEEDSNHLSEDISLAHGVNLVNQSLLLPPPPEELIIDQPKAQKESFKMDDDKIETIKSVMKSITLPVSNLPQWASNVPEEEWKAALLSQMLKENCNIGFPVGETTTKLAELTNEDSR